MPTQGISVAQGIWPGPAGSRVSTHSLSDVPPGSQVLLRPGPACFLLASMEPEEEAFVRSEGDSTA